MWPTVGKSPDAEVNLEDFLSCGHRVASNHSSLDLGKTQILVEQFASVSTSKMRGKSMWGTIRVSVC